MSADNYFYIRRDGDRFAVSMGFMSDGYASDPGGDFAPPLKHHHPRFDTLDEAQVYAYSEYSEYGVIHEPGLEPE